MPVTIKIDGEAGDLNAVYQQIIQKQRGMRREIKRTANESRTANRQVKNETSAASRQLTGMVTNWVSIAGAIAAARASLSAFNQSMRAIDQTALNRTGDAFRQALAAAPSGAARDQFRGLLSELAATSGTPQPQIAQAALLLQRAAPGGGAPSEFDFFARQPGTGARQHFVESTLRRAVGVSDATGIGVTDAAQMLLRLRRRFPQMSAQGAGNVVAQLFRQGVDPRVLERVLPVTGDFEGGPERILAQITTAAQELGGRPTAGFFGALAEVRTRGASLERLADLPTETLRTVSPELARVAGLTRRIGRAGGLRDLEAGFGAAIRGPDLIAPLLASIMSGRVTGQVKAGEMVTQQIAGLEEQRFARGDVVSGERIARIARRRALEVTDPDTGFINPGMLPIVELLGSLGGQALNIVAPEVMARRIQALEGSPTEQPVPVVLKSEMIAPPRGMETGRGDTPGAPTGPAQP